MSGGHVKLESLTKRFDDVTAVDEISVEIQAGEFFSLLGPSGCGKTTTLRMVAGFEPPTSGKILLDGIDVGNWAPNRRNVNTVFQSYALFPFLTVAENVAFGMKYKSVPKSERDSRVAEALELVQLSGYEKRRPNQLSGGQQQRVALARALVLRPAVLLLDEPLGALDAKLRRTLQVELGALQKQVGITFLYVTHDQEEALTMSDRLAVMNHGRIAQLGTPEEVYNEPADAYVADFLGVSNLMDARVEPGGNGQGPCRLRLGDFMLEAQAGQLDATGAVKVAIRPSASTCIRMRLAVSTACRGWSSASSSSARPRRSTSASPRARRFRRWCATTGSALPYSQGTPVSMGLPADALRVLPDPGVSVAEIRDETLGDQLLDVTSSAADLELTAAAEPRRPASVASISAASAASGTASLVARETLAAAGAPIVSPVAHARLSSIEPNTSAAPICSIASVMIEIAGIAKAVSGPPRVSTVSTASTSGDCGSGSNASRTAIAPRPALSGSNTPRRSTRRPTAGFTSRASSDASTNVTPIATPDAPKCDRRSGSRVPVAPIVAASSRISQKPSRSWGLLRARAAALRRRARREAAPGAGASTRSAPATLRRRR